MALSCALGALQADSGLRACDVLSRPVVCDELERTPLMLAYWRGSLACAHMMASLGGDYEATDKLGRSVAWYVEHCGAGRALDESSRILRGKVIEKIFEEKTRHVRKKVGAGQRKRGTRISQKRRGQL